MGMMRNAPQPALLLQYATGFYYATPGSTASAAATKDALYYTPFWFVGGQAWDKIGVYVATGVASSVARLGIYSSVNGKPSAKMAEGASTPSTASSSSAAEADLTWTAPYTGVFWLASVNQGGASGATLTALNQIALMTPSEAVTNANRPGFYETGVSGALPASAGTLNANTATVPRVFVRAA